MSNVECRMSNVEGGQKTPWTLSEVPSAPIWCSPVRKKRKRKRKMKGNQICEKMTAQTENSLITYWLSRKRALCATCKKSDPAETNLSRASRVRQDSQFHTVDKGDILFEWKILYRARILRSGVAVDPGEQEIWCLLAKLQLPWKVLSEYDYLWRRNPNKQVFFIKRIWHDFGPGSQ